MADSDSSAMTAVIAIIAIIAVAVIAFLLFGRGLNNGTANPAGGAGINVNLPAGDGGGNAQ